MLPENADISPVKYGVMWQKVYDMDKKMDKMERQLEELVALANKGKGSLWVGMSIASMAATLIGYLMNIGKST